MSADKNSAPSNQTRNTVSEISKTIANVLKDETTINDKKEQNTPLMVAALWLALTPAAQGVPAMLSSATVAKWIKGLHPDKSAAKGTKADTFASILEHFGLSTGAYKVVEIGKHEPLTVAAQMKAANERARSIKNAHMTLISNSLLIAGFLWNHHKAKVEVVSKGWLDVPNKAIDPKADGGSSTFRPRNRGVKTGLLANARKAYGIVAASAATTSGTGVSVDAALKIVADATAQPDADIAKSGALVAVTMNALRKALEGQAFDYQKAAPETRAAYRALFATMVAESVGVVPVDMRKPLADALAKDAA